MDVRLTPEQHALRDSVARVVGHHGVHAVGELDDTARASKLNTAIVAAGWRELRTDTGRGEPLASAVEVAIVAEELARGLGDAAFCGPILAAELRRLAGAPDTTTIETVLFDGKLAGLLGQSINGDQSTSKDRSIAIDAAGATSALLVVASGDHYNIGMFDLAAERTLLDLTRPSARPSSAEATRLVAEQQTPLSTEALTRWTAFGLALTAADLVGTMRGTIELATEYAKARQQYGVAVGSFQAVQHMLADALVAMEGSRSVTLHAAWAVDALAPDDALGAAALAKAYCARAARRVCETSIQVHGGIGNTWECLGHVYLRRALLSIDMLGGIGPSLKRVLAHHDVHGDAGSTQGGTDGLR